MTDLFFCLVFWAMFGLCAANVYGGIMHGTVYARTTQYRRGGNKFLFWLALIANLPLTLMSFGIAFMFTANLFGWEI